MITSRPTPRPPAPGTRCVLTGPVERGPHCIAAAGATGTVVHADQYTVCVHMDDYMPGAESWDNEIIWAIEDDCDNLGIPSANPSATAAFQRATKLLDDESLGSAETPAKPTQRRLSAQTRDLDSSPEGGPR